MTEKILARIIPVILFMGTFAISRERRIRDMIMPFLLGQYLSRRIRIHVLTTEMYVVTEITEPGSQNGRSVGHGAYV